jgi:nucleoside-diphosphate-sugar epimerase
MESSGKKIITVLGGSGYVGSKCIETLLHNFKDVKIYAVSRSGRVNFNDSRVEGVQGDCLYPATFQDIIKKSDGIIHSIGVLFTTDNEKYHLMNKETCLRVAKIANDSNRPQKPNLVYVSASRGIPFPLSLKFHGYIDAKRECEKRLKEEFPNINPIILRPGFVKSWQKKWTYPIYYSVGAVEFAERLLLNRISSSLGEKLQLPSKGIDVDTLANFACYGALGLLNPGQIYDNDYMNNRDNLVKLH